MKKTIQYIIACVLLLLPFSGCDVHEFPEERHEKVPFLLHLDFSDEMPLYKEIEYSRNGETRTKGSAGGHDIRYIISAYRADNRRDDSRVADTTFVFTSSDISNLDYTASLELREGTYSFIVWADYVDSGSSSDKYYDTRDFSEIILSDPDNHSGSNDYRDAFRGYATANIMNPAYYSGDSIDSIDNQARVEMRRPMGKFKFISTDVEIFLTRVAMMMKEQGVLFSSDIEPDTKTYYKKLLQSINFGEYYVVFRYNIFMPCSYNIFTDKPADSWTGMSFKSPIHIEEDLEMSLGYDYIFVNGSETTLSISLEVYNQKGELISSSNAINVPIVRSKLTLVKGEFLTTKANGGVSINPSFDGDDYNIEIL